LKGGQTMFIFQPYAIFKKDEETGAYEGFSPNVAGAFSCGDTIEEALADMKDAVEGVMECALENGYKDVLNQEEYHVKPGEIALPVPVDNRLRVAATIHLAREKAGLSQAEFAVRTGLNRETVSRYERGKRMPSAEKFLDMVETV
jgi:antitoxin HicB